MSLRTLTEDLVYTGTDLVGRSVATWGSLPKGIRRVLLVGLLVLMLIIWIGPRVGLFDRSKSGFTDEELRLIERSGAAPSNQDKLPWWYRTND